MSQRVFEQNNVNFSQLIISHVEFFVNKNLVIMYTNLKGRRDNSILKYYFTKKKCQNIFSLYWFGPKEMIFFFFILERAMTRNSQTIISKLIYLMEEWNNSLFNYFSFWFIKALVNVGVFTQLILPPPQRTEKKCNFF